MNDAAATRAQVTAVLRLIRALSTQTDRYADQVRQQLGMPRTDLTAMGVINDSARDGRNLTPGALAHEMHLPASTVTALLDRLERVGHVVRERDLHDRRKVMIGVTESASELGSQAFRPLSEAIRRALSTHTDEELTLLAGLLADVVQAVSRAVDEQTTRPDTGSSAAPPG